MAPVRVPGIFESPRQYMLWAVRQKPAIFWSCVVGCIGPLMVLIVPPIRERLGDGPRPRIPITYPIPRGPRNTSLTGYED